MMKLKILELEQPQTVAVLTIDIEVDGASVGECRVHANPRGWSVNAEDMELLGHNSDLLAELKAQGLSREDFVQQLFAKAEEYQSAF